jgi:hypothetical protein
MNTPVGTTQPLALARTPETMPPQATGTTVEPSAPRQTAAGALTPRAAQEPVMIAALPKNLTASQVANKRVVVIDIFDVKTLNINRGDTVPDVSHGEVCARIAEGVVGRPVERVDVGNGHGDFDAQRFSAALDTLIREKPDGNYAGLVLSVSLGAAGEDGLEGDMLKIKQQLDRLGRGGAQVFLAAGNESINGFAGPHVITVGSSDAVVGRALVSTPNKDFVKNPETDVIANGRPVTTPVHGRNGQIEGLKLTERSPPFALTDLVDVSPRIKAIEGQTVAQAQLMRPEVATLFAKFNQMSIEQRAAYDFEVHGSKVIAFGDANAVIGLSGHAPIKTPTGADPRNLYVSATGVLSCMAGRSKAPQVVFFSTDRNGHLRPLGNDGLTLLPRGTSFAAPQFAEPQSPPRTH